MTDLEIAKKATIKPITLVASTIGLKEEDLILFGKDKAKVTKRPGEKKGKLILVTAMSPTPYGEGKTTVSIGLADAFHQLGKSVSLSLREPSLGPVFGVKGGATGGGHSQLNPMVDINLHFTGDFHAITSCNNLISAAIYNHIEKGNNLGFDQVLFERCLDVNDRTLRDIHIFCGKKEYSTAFRITSASEIMALFCLSHSLDDLKMRLGRIVVGLTKDKKVLTCHDLKLEGALTVLLKDAFLPNLVQTLEGTPAFVHGGPFANIAHGTSSINSLNLALSQTDYVITEAGFGSDLGAEKFLNIVCEEAKIAPNVIILVVTLRSLYHHGENSLDRGLSNLKAHLDHLENYHVPVVVCINQFANDSEEEISLVRKYCMKQGVLVVSTTSYQDGGKGALDFALLVENLCKKENNFHSLVDKTMTLDEKLKVLGEKVYGAVEIEYSKKAFDKIEILKKNNFYYLPICVAKTQYSISDDPHLLGYPKNTTLHVIDIKLNAGAGFITVLLGNIMTMPGLPKQANYENIDYIDNEVIGLF